MLFILTSVFLVFNTKIDNWYLYILLNLVLIYAIWKIVNAYELRAQSSEIPNNSILKILRYWYGIAVILIIFKQVYFIIYYIKPPDWDLLLIKLDFMIFGVNPTQWIYKFNNPYVTEFLQWIYAYYYPMMAVFGLELYLWKKFDKFKYTLFIFFFSFYFSYILYMIFPANGPRFHLHDFSTISVDLPGVFITEYIRAFLNFGESIPSGVSNPQDYVQRDAMPSLHIITAFLIMYLSKKFGSKSFYFYLPYFFLMTLATVYLRYHYVVDIVGGIAVSVFTIWLGLIIYKNRINT